MRSAGWVHNAAAPNTIARTRSRRRTVPLALVAILTGGGAAASGQPDGNAVTRWNAVATHAFTPSQGTNPMAQSRTLAILHAAMHDALNAIEPRFQMYSPGLGRANGASAEAA